MAEHAAAAAWTRRQEVYRPTICDPEPEVATGSTCAVDGGCAADEDNGAEDPAVDDGASEP
ncbi:hypothetical protein ACQP2U_09880 [Nocardia sp. CA-084685]|uniref:hypothetical protein n=1 Tax=Nocardia sp. CA-084685 TaxID=3239970 RepID=UPI003D9A097B